MWQSRILTLILIGLLALLSIHVFHQNLSGVRADVTGDNLYSLTPGTIQILDKMKQEGAKPIDIKLYFSDTAGKTLPKFVKDFVTYERYIRALLKEYGRRAEGKIRVHFIDPIPDSDEAQDANDYGLDGKVINQHGDLFFFGLVFETQTGSKDVIDFLWPQQQESIEYEMSKKIYNLLWPPSQRIGLLSGLEVLGTADNPYLAQMQARLGRPQQQKWVSMQLLEESYEVRKLEPTTDHISPEEYDLVLVIHPKNLSENALWALDEWVLTGHNALIFLDPYTVTDQPPRNPQQPWAALEYRPASNLSPLLEAWGLERPEDQFAADLELAVRRPVTPRGPAESILIDLAIDDAVADQTLAADHPILQGVANLRLLLPGVLTRSDSSTAEITPLITTTASGNTLTIEPGFGGGEALAFTDINDPAKLRDRFAPGTEPQVLAYLVNGQLASAFPEGADFPADPPTPPPGLPPGVQLPPPEDAEMVHKDPIPEEERGEATVVVLADVDLIADQIAFQQNLLGFLTTPNDNHKVLLNSVDYLLGARELMNVRAKKTIDRPFLLFDEIEKEAERETLERERQIRADVESFQSELQKKQSEITAPNAALFQKKLQDEVDALNDKIREGNRELREIRISRRAALEQEEAKVRFAILGWMPTLILALGIFLSVRRRTKDAQAKRSE